MVPVAVGAAVATVPGPSCRRRLTHDPAPLVMWPRTSVPADAKITVRVAPMSWACCSNGEPFATVRTTSSVRTTAAVFGSLVKAPEQKSSVPRWAAAVEVEFRQAYGKGGAVARPVTGSGEGASVSADDGAGDGQAESTATSGRVGSGRVSPVKPFEDFFQFAGWNASPVIVHTQHELSGLRGNSHMDVSCADRRRGQRGRTPSRSPRMRLHTAHGNEREAVPQVKCSLPRVGKTAGQ